MSDGRRGKRPELMDDGYTPFTSGVNCITCGRFVGRDGHLAYEHFEMSPVLASLDGECRACIDTAVAPSSPAPDSSTEGSQR